MFRLLLRTFAGSLLGKGQKRAASDCLRSEADLLARPEPPSASVLLQEWACAAHGSLGPGGPRRKVFSGGRGAGGVRWSDKTHVPSVLRARTEPSRANEVFDEVSPGCLSWRGASLVGISVMSCPERLSVLCVRAVVSPSKILTHSGLWILV